MSKLSDFLASGGSLKPFQDLGTVTGTVNLDLSQYGSFRVVQGAGDITLNVINADPDGAGVFELFFYRNFDWAVSFVGFEFVGNGYQDLPQGDMTTLDYDSVSFSVKAQDTLPRDIAFNADGTKMFMVGNANGSVHQYSLTTGFDLSTASYDNVSFNVAAQDVFPYGIAFNTDGTKMFMVGYDNNSVYQYSLTTGFDLSTASYDSVSFSVAAQDTQPLGIAFNNDGTKMFVSGLDNDSVYQYSLTTGFDLLTASYDNVSFSVTAQDTQPYSFAFNTDGTKMFMVGYVNDSVFQYTLTTGFDLSTASYDSVSFSVAAQDAKPAGIAFNTNGTKMFMVGLGNDSVYQYTPTYDFGPLFTYPLTQIGNKVTLDTKNADFSIKDAV